MERRHLLSALVVFAAFVAALIATSSQVLGAPAPGVAPQDPETVAAKQGPFAVVQDVTGSFDAPDAIEVAYRPEVYRGVLEVAEAATPGPVAKGQLLIRFLTKKIDEQIKDAELELKIARTNSHRLTEEAKRKKEAYAIELESAQMAHKNARQTYETFKDVLMPMRIKEAELSLQASKDRLKEAEEQFVQLQKMYKSDDLVEETEEIVLRRSKRSLEQSRARMAFTLRRHKLRLDVDIPRELRGYELKFRQAANDWELAKATSTLRIEQSSSELQKAMLKLARQERSLEDLKRDREALTIKAPAAGMAVPGWLVKGKWTGLAKNTKTLRPGEKASANNILFSIVTPGPRMVRTAIPESTVLDVKIGHKATVAPAAIPRATLAAKIVRVARVSADGNFDAWLEVAKPDSRLIAGNSCKITLTTSELEDAITVPSTAISKADDRSVVYLWQDGKSKPREVQVGATSRGRTAILSGLVAGEHVLRRAPGQKKK